MIDSSLERTFNNVSPTTQFECYQNFQHPTTASLFFYSMKSVSRTMDPINASEDFSSVNLRLISF